MGCHTSAKLDKLVAEKQKVRITFFDGKIYEGWVEGPYIGCGYILENPEKDFSLKFYKSYVKKLEECLENV